MWSIIVLVDEEQCNLIMSALDLTWHWGKGFLYVALMTRIVLIMEGLDSNYEIPSKILNLFAFEIVAYFLLTPVLDLVTTRADHRLYKFIDERSIDPVYVCGEVIEYWISFLLLFGDLLLCSTTIGVYLYAVGEMIIEPIQNQKLIDICIRYAIFSIFASIFIMMGNGIWSTNTFASARYFDSIFCVISIMFLLTACTSCYKQCCEGCHKKLRSKYITRFLIFKENLIIKEFNERKNNPKYILKSYDRTFDEKLTAILSQSNLQNHSMDTYHQNVQLHHIHSTTKTKKKLKKLKKRLKKQQSKKGLETPTIPLNDRELQTIGQLLNFGSTMRAKTVRNINMNLDVSNDTNNSNKTKTVTPSINDDGFEYNDYSINLGVDTDQSNIVPLGGGNGDNKNSGTTTIRKGVRKKKNVGLLAQLNPDDSALPKSLTIAIHASVIDTVKLDKEKIELSATEKIGKRMDELYTKVDTFWDENIILFPRRSPTIYPGQAYKLTRAERFALQERKEEIEQNEYSKSEEHSDSADSHDEVDGTALKIEQEWSTTARKYGNGKQLDDIYEILQEVQDEDLIKIWDFFDKENKKKLNYRDGLVKLLGAFFLLYFRKKYYNNGQEDINGHNSGYTKINEQPPKFEEIEPVLSLLAKYIRDALRKKKKKYLKKSDYQKNFKKYLRDAIEKRNQYLEKRKNKLQSQSSMLSMTSDVSSNWKSSDLNANLSDNDYKIEEEEEDVSQLLIGLDVIGKGTRLPTIKSEGNAVQSNSYSTKEQKKQQQQQVPNFNNNGFSESINIEAFEQYMDDIDDDDDDDGIGLDSSPTPSKKKQQRQSSKFNDGKQAQIELQQILNTYVPRESTNKLIMKRIINEEEEEEKYKSPKLKIDKQIEQLKQRRERNQKQYSSQTNMSLLHRDSSNNKNNNKLAPIKDDDVDIDNIQMQSGDDDDDDDDIGLCDDDDTPPPNTKSNNKTITTKTQKQQFKLSPNTQAIVNNNNGYDSDVDVDKLRLSDASEQKQEINDNDLPTTDIKNGNKSSSIQMSLGEMEDILKHVNSDTNIIPQTTPIPEDEEDDDNNNNNNDNNGHTKDATDGTEIFNANAMTPRKHKVVVIDEKQIKHDNNQDSLQISDDLFNSAMNIADDDDDDDNNKDHKATETVVEINKESKHKDIKTPDSDFGQSVDFDVDQGLMDDVLGTLNDSD